VRKDANKTKQNNSTREAEHNKIKKLPKAHIAKSMRNYNNDWHQEKK
jgi:hypothetical protein